MLGRQEWGKTSGGRGLGQENIVVQGLALKLLFRSSAKWNHRRLNQSKLRSPSRLVPRAAVSRRHLPGVCAPQHPHGTGLAQTLHHLRSRQFQLSSLTAPIRCSNNVSCPHHLTKRFKYLHYLQKAVLLLKDHPKNILLPFSL